jgi:hypothetical protein
MLTFDHGGGILAKYRLRNMRTIPIHNIALMEKIARP